jgi:drug/metabolite transporter (DMT)-like permease
MTILGFSSRDASDSAIALLVISSVLWGSSFVSVKIGLAYVNVYDFAFLRLAVASVILFVILILLGKFKPAALRDGSVWILGLLNGTAFSLQYVGLLFTTAAKTALLVDLNVIVVAVLSWRLFRESFGLRKQLAVILGALGAVMITTNDDLSSLGQGELFGDVLVFSAGLVWAFFIVMHKKLLLRSERNVVELSAVVMLVTAVLLSPMAALFGGLNLRAVSIEGWGWVAFIAIGCTVLPYALWILALKAVTATIASVVGMLEIVAAMILSTLLLGEAYSILTIVGAAMILLSILAVAES